MINSHNQIIEQTKSDVALLTLRNDSIITFEPHTGVVTNKVEVMEFELEVFLRWSKDEKKGFLVDTRNFNNFGSEERDFAEQHFNNFCIRIAVLKSAGISSVVVNFFLYLHRPEIPMKAFSNVEDAIKWLKE